MESIRDIPFLEELPSAYADRLGLLYTATVSTDHKKKLGQFFTTPDVAEYMASFAFVNKERVDILDPGCGVGILSCALIEKLVKKNTHIKEVILTAFESDAEVLTYTDKCFAYLSEWLKRRQIKLTYFLCKNDFILHNSGILTNDKEANELYDIIITNPPYFKIKKNDERTIAAKSVIYGQSNIYSIFLIIACHLLQAEGQLIFITPRSFAAGSYFRVFRETFFSLMNIVSIHIFDSRRVAFKRDKILQENIIINSIKKKLYSKSQLQLDLIYVNDVVDISVSDGTNNLSNSKSKKYLFEDLVNIDSYQKILHIPTSKIDDKVIGIFKNWTGSLSSYGFQISTGPVVDFRSRQFINSISKKGYVPLIWLHNVNKMLFTWPDFKAQKGKPKGEFIKSSTETSSRLISNDNYVFLRRFSTKDDKSRLIACPYLKTWLLDYDKLGVENHLNYIYKPNGKLSVEEVYGIAALLNSKLFDVYFRTFNGNINVSATELREMPLPNLNIIVGIGKQIQLQKNINEKIVNQIVGKIFDIHLI